MAVETAPQLAGVPFTEKAVRQGDSLSRLAMEKYGQATPTILDMLKLANPRLSDVDVIPVGQTIRLPELSDGFPTLVEGSGQLAMLVYSSPRQDRAQTLQKALRGHGFEARVSTGRFGAQKPIYRVVLTGFSDRTQVAAAGRELQKVLREDRRIAQLGD
jgi:phage tail protein X